MRLMDAEVCIDITRKHPPALQWLAALTDPVAVAGFAAVELVVGCRNSAELHQAHLFLARYAIVWASEASMNRALSEYAPLRISHGLGGFDALIAATVTGAGMTLITFDTRHFAVVPGLLTEQPYLR